MAPTNHSINKSGPAETDLNDIYGYLFSEAGAETADKVLTGILDAIETLATFPERGPSPPELGLNVRMLVHGSYLIFYTVTNNTVTIARVLHHRRNVRNNFKNLGR